MSSLPPLRLKRTPCLVLRPRMRNSTGSPVFSDFQSDLSRVAVSRPLVKGNEDAGYEGAFEPIYKHQQRTFDFVNNSLNFV